MASGDNGSQRRTIYCTCHGTEPMGYWFDDRVYWYRKSHGLTHSAVHFFNSEGPPISETLSRISGTGDQVESETSLTEDSDSCYPELSDPSDLPNGSESAPQ